VAQPKKRKRTTPTKAKATRPRAKRSIKGAAKSTRKSKAKPAPIKKRQPSKPARAPVSPPVKRKAQPKKTKPAKPAAKKGRRSGDVSAAKRKKHSTAKPARKPAVKPARKPAPRKPAVRKVSAARARELARVAAEQAAAERRERRRLGQRRRRREFRRQREIGEYAVAVEWLEAIRDRITEDAFAVELETTEPGGGSADLEHNEGARAAQLADDTKWLVVGRFDPAVEISYEDLARGIQAVANDVILETRINSQRLAQIRVVFHDPKSGRQESDSVVSKIGAWEYILSDLVGELVGSNLEHPDDDSLAARYDETIVPKFYIFFSTEILAYKTAFPSRTTTVPWSR
jgi:hypothetical protein